MPFKVSAFIGLIVLGGLLAAGCAKPPDSANSADAPASASPTVPQASGATGSSLSSAQRPAVVAGDLTRGEAIYNTNCVGCHGAKGVSSGIGPSLVGEKGRKSTAAAIAWIKDPQPPMAKLYPSPLSEKDVADVAAYVESL